MLITLSSESSEPKQNLDDPEDASFDLETPSRFLDPPFFTEGDENAAFGSEALTVTGVLPGPSSSAPSSLE